MLPLDLDIQKVIKDLELNIIHCFDPEHNRGGVTICYKKCENHRNSRMVEVSVSYCSQHDSYNKKIGVRQAVERFYYNETITVPARSYNCDDSIPINLERMFASFI